MKHTASGSRTNISHETKRTDKGKAREKTPSITREETIRLGKRRQITLPELSDIEDTVSGPPHVVSGLSGVVDED